MSVPLVVGFDLDMTLIDARVGIAATYRALVARTGVAVDIDAAVSRIGAPLHQELANWFQSDQVQAAVRGYRALYPDHLNDSCRMMPGADGAVAAVRRHSGRGGGDHLKAGPVRPHPPRPPRTRRRRDRGGPVRPGQDRGDAGTRGRHLRRRSRGRHARRPGRRRDRGRRDHRAALRAELAAAGGEPVLPDLRQFPAWLATRLTSPVTAEDWRTGTG